MAEMDMVERVARAIQEKFPTAGRDKNDGNLRSQPIDRRVALDLSRAAIVAMHSPTPAMIAAAWRKISADKKAAGVAKLGPGPGCIEWWNAAIDAALSDTSSKG